MILQLKHITFSFSPEKQILKDLSLSLDERKIYALMGSNGAGKTTLFNLISGFIKPQSGEVFFSEKNLTRQPPYKINRQGIGRTFQDLRLITQLSVKENIILSMQQNPTDKWMNAMLLPSFYRGSNTAMEKKAAAIMEYFFINEVQHSLAGEISYGQQKLLTLACCKANGAGLLLLDEPVAGLQPEYRNKIAVVLKEMKQQGKTILLIEHTTDFIADVADEILFLHEGSITRFASVESLRADKTVMEAYI